MYAANVGAPYLAAQSSAGTLGPCQHWFSARLHPEHDFRAPDGGLHRPGAAGVGHATAPVVVEILAPDDETWQKLPFFAAHHVDEVLVVDPGEWTVAWLALRDGEYEPVDRGALIDLGASELARQINWP